MFPIINKPRNQVRSIFKYLYHTLQSKCICENFIYVIEKSKQIILKVNPLDDKVRITRDRSWIKITFTIAFRMERAN